MSWWYLTNFIVDKQTLWDTERVLLIWIVPLRDVLFHDFGWSQLVVCELQTQVRTNGNEPFWHFLNLAAFKNLYHLSCWNHWDYPRLLRIFDHASDCERWI